MGKGLRHPEKYTFQKNISIMKLMIGCKTPGENVIPKAIDNIGSLR